MSTAASQRESLLSRHSARDAVVQGHVSLPSDDRFLVDLDRLDLGSVYLDRAGLDRWIPHRHEMAMLDGVVWKSQDCTHGVALKHVRDDEFWVRGHFPGKPMLPGVLMVEAGAQLCCFLFNLRQPETALAAFLRIESVAFRRAVEPGETLYLLAREVRFQRRRFISDIQGVVDGQLCFEAQITGLNMGAADGGA